MTFRRVVVPLPGFGQSPVLPFACCVGSLRSVGRCSRCSCWCRLRSRSPVAGVLRLCWMWHGVPFVRQRRPVVGVLKLCWLLQGSFDCFSGPHTSVLRPSTTCLAACARGPGALLCTGPRGAAKPPIPPAPVSPWGISWAFPVGPRVCGPGQWLEGAVF